MSLWNLRFGCLLKEYALWECIMDYDFEWEFLTEVFYALDIASGQSFGKQRLNDIHAVLNSKGIFKVNMAVPFSAGDARHIIKTLLDYMGVTATIRFDEEGRVIIIDNKNDTVEVLCDAKSLVLDILMKIKLTEEYRVLCNRYNDINGSGNFKIQEQKSIIYRHDEGFKHFSRDRVFSKESTLGEYTIRIFLPAKSPIVDFSYLIWDDSIHAAPYLKGDITSLVETLEPEFSNSVKHKRPIAASLIEYDAILTVYFSLLNAFLRHVDEADLKSKEIINFLKQEMHATQKKR